jgi:prepilin-type N-terminal cleavage/methylation domain-containing protein
MKTKCDKWQVTSDTLAARGEKSRRPSPVTRHSWAFTLIELLVVISIMGVLAGFTIPVLGKIKEAQYKKVARAELERIETALEGYKAKYGTYPPSNQNPTNTYTPQGMDRAQFSQLYYELSGVTHDAVNKNFTTLDGSSTIAEGNYFTAYHVGGVVNSSKGSGEDSSNAKNFLSGLKANQLETYATNSGVRTTMLITSVGGPDDAYKPLQASGLNPFRYIFPGIKNPNSYDLWVQLVIKGKTNLICNWNKQVEINSPLP